MHQPAYDFVRFALVTVARSRAVPGSVVEFGGQDVNESALDLSIRALLPKDCEYLSVDIVPGFGVDVVADCGDWRTDKKYEVVICCETLEHTPRGRDIIQSAFEALQKDGWLILTCATDPRPTHGAATDLPLPEEYYKNVDFDELKKWFIDWTEVHSIVNKIIGDIYILAQK